MCSNDQINGEQSVAQQVLNFQEEKEWMVWALGWASHPRLGSRGRRAVWNTSGRRQQSGRALHGHWDFYMYVFLNTQINTFQNTNKSNSNFIYICKKRMQASVGKFLWSTVLSRDAEKGNETGPFCSYLPSHHPSVYKTNFLCLYSTVIRICFLSCSLS